MQLAHQARQIWTQQIHPKWNHANHPVGQRFLGSISISQRASNQLLDDIVGRDLRKVTPFTFHHLRERYEVYDGAEYWIRLLTLALSEYAYYDECDNGFWQGLCDRLDLQNTQGVQNTLREVVYRGSTLLGLRVAHNSHSGGIHHVSTLCLQSGIPQQNLRHFAQLLEALSRQYDWWDIAHAEPKDLSELLYDLCQNRYPQWGRLLTFLRSSCTDSDEEAEPISGELLQGIAIVAQALERQGLEPAVLQDAHQREQLLQNFCLPNTFFLRSWDNLIRVLTPQKEGSSSRKRIVSLRKKPLLLMLDVADSMDIQLVLSAQMLWQSDWRNWRGTYAQIQEHGWETRLPIDGALEVPELTWPLCNIAQDWVWHLRSHNGATLTKWHCQGVTQDFPVLIFDAWTGDRLTLTNGLSELTGVTEITCFCSREVQLELSDGIEIIDSFVPCSIRGWRGQQLYLCNEQARLTVCHNGSSQVIQWNQAQSAYPQLRGLKLKRRESTYFQVPSVWYPPIAESREIRLEIENIDTRQILTEANQRLPLSINANWQEISLSRWINRSGTYLVKLWSGNERWSEQFKLQSSFVVEQPSQGAKIQVCDRTNTPIDIPQQATSSSKFWLEELTLKNLWPLEDIRFVLSNGQAEYQFVKSANASGSLCCNLATLRDTLAQSGWYGLSYQRLGQEWDLLLEVGSREQITCTWTQESVQLSGLCPDTSYILLLWNLLYPNELPNSLPVENNEDDEEIIIPLLSQIDNIGIFYIELQHSITAPQSLGWWSNIRRKQELLLPDDIAENDIAEAYCFNILDNEEAQEFCTLLNQIGLSIDYGLIRRSLIRLQSGEGYLPEWIDQNLLITKLEYILTENTSQPGTISSSDPQSNNQGSDDKNNKDSEIFNHSDPERVRKWYLTNIRYGYNQAHLIEEINSRDNHHFIHRCEAPQRDEYQQYILIEVNKLSNEIRDLLRGIPSFYGIERRPLSIQQVHQMLGGSPNDN